MYECKSHIPKCNIQNCSGFLRAIISNSVFKRSTSIFSSHLKSNMTKTKIIYSLKPTSSSYGLLSWIKLGSHPQCSPISWPLGFSATKTFIECVPFVTKACDLNFGLLCTLLYKILTSQVAFLTSSLFFLSSFLSLIMSN